jgi:hypothetical protein
VIRRESRWRTGEVAVNAAFITGQYPPVLLIGTRPHRVERHRPILMPFAIWRAFCQGALKVILSIPCSLPLFVVVDDGVKVESPQRSEENRP